MRVRVRARVRVRVRVRRVHRVGRLVRGRVRVGVRARVRVSVRCAGLLWSIPLQEVLLLLLLLLLPLVKHALDRRPQRRGVGL